MLLSEFNFQLPPELIATRPMSPRGEAKLLVSTGGQLKDARVSNICKFLKPGDRLVLNNTKVIPARLNGVRWRDSIQGLGKAKIEVTLIEPLSSGKWKALIKPLRKLQVGEIVLFREGLTATCTRKLDGEATLAFSMEGDELDSAIDKNGQMPLPPYIASKRAADEQDRLDYQTVWAKYRGAVAAPTASLHLDELALLALADHGVDITFVTLHVGAGTFLPVKVDNIRTHKMHAEWGCVSRSAVKEIEATKSDGGRIIPVGTTALRLIETASISGTIKPFEGDTDIFIYPGFQFRITDGLLTNFHLPQSTLLMLVAAFVGKTELDAIYQHAISGSYRFFSYGDASLLFPN
jgi:S-adenosylmethionine:tRNA ribosyltransferase-isomerase